MILFINVFLEHNPDNLLTSPYGMNYDRGNLPIYTKGEIFLYTLESYKTISWSKVYIYCEVNSSFPDPDSFYENIKSIFPEADIHKKRNAYQHEWQNAIDQFEDDIIWYSGNHDHPYIAPNHNQLNNLIEVMNSSDYFYKGALYSHYPDICARIMNQSFYNFKREKKYVSSYIGERVEGIMILNKNLLRSWWFDYDYGNNFMPRADWIDGVRCQTPESKIFLPVKELCRHFDGHNFGGYSYDMRDIPPLDIPRGFWQSEIQIDYLTDNRSADNLWINPLKNYYASDIDGSDFKLFLDDLPLFWKSRISKINYGSDQTRQYCKARSLAILNTANPRAYFNSMMTKGMDMSSMTYRSKIAKSYIKEILQ